MPILHLDDINLYYEITGQGDPLVFIHGLGSSTRDWEAQADFFAKRYQVILFDVRGHGKSAKPPGPYSIPLFAADTAKLIEKLTTAPVHVVGISMGGMIAFQLAIDHPEMLKSLVIVNSSPEYVARTFQERLQAWQRFLVVRIFGMRKIGEILSERIFPKPEHGEIRDVFVERWAENDPRAYRESMRAILGWSVMGRLGEITCPTLVIASDEDYTPVEEKEAYLEQIPKGELAVVEDARHGLPAEKPEEFNAVLESFLQSQGS
ncbi:MAG: 3-oxoadipate enol-lactonase 2 [Chloroflexi bacterium]|nr:3-oxoadipate enol-lactonase 2 [Chloroflexota bacterium]